MDFPNQLCWPPLNSGRRTFTRQAERDLAIALEPGPQGRRMYTFLRHASGDEVNRLRSIQEQRSTAAVHPPTERDPWMLAQVHERQLDAELTKNPPPKPEVDPEQPKFMRGISNHDAAGQLRRKQFEDRRVKAPVAWKTGTGKHGAIPLINTAHRPKPPPQDGEGAPHKLDAEAVEKLSERLTRVRERKKLDPIHMHRTDGCPQFFTEKGAERLYEEAERRKMKAKREHEMMDKKLTETRGSKAGPKVTDETFSARYCDQPLQARKGKQEAAEKKRQKLANESRVVVRPETAAARLYESQVKRQRDAQIKSMEKYSPRRMIVPRPPDQLKVSSARLWRGKSSQDPNGDA